MFQEIYEVKKTEDKILSGNVCRHDLGAQAPMNGASYYDGRNHMFAAGMDDECHLFSLKYKVVSPTKQGMLCIYSFYCAPKFFEAYCHWLVCSSVVHTVLAYLITLTILGIVYAFVVLC